MLIRKTYERTASPASKTCPNCHASFKRIDHFQNHKIVCDNNNESSMNDEQFTPLFACLDNLVIEFAEIATNDSLSTPSSPLEIQNVNSDAELKDVVSHQRNDQVVPEHEPEHFDTPFSPLKATPILDKNTGRDWCTLKETQQRVENLESIIQTLSSPVKRHVIRTVVGKHNKTVNEISTYTKSSDIYEAKMCQALLKELSHLHKSKRYSVFDEKLHVLFGEQLDDEKFLKWIHDKLGIRKSRFIDSVRHWKAIEYKESRRREGISLESKQIIYNTWI